MSVKTKNWLKAAGNRVIRTMSQTLIASIGTAAVMSQVNWKMTVSATILSGLLSIAMSLMMGLPELEVSPDGSRKGERI